MHAPRVVTGDLNHMTVLPAVAAPAQRLQVRTRMDATEPYRPHMVDV